MSPQAREFAPMPARDGWSRCAFPGGELRARAEALDELERAGLLDLDRWRREELGGVTVNRKPDRWVRAVPGEGRALFAKYRRGVRRGEWLGELLHARVPRSAAAREDRAALALESLGLSTARVVLSGEMTTALGVERESFLVTEELVGFDPIEGVAWSRISPALREILRRLSERRVAVPDLYAKHLFLRQGSAADLAVVDLPRVETRTLRSALELFVRHAGALVATVPGADARELALAFPNGAGPEPAGDADGGALERRIRARAALVRRRKKLPAPREDYFARTRYLGAQPVAQYRERSSRRDRAEQALVEALLPARIDGLVLDAPSGYGRMSALLRARGGRPVSLDISPDMARAAAGESGSAVIAELERLPLADGAVDGALCVRFLHHVTSRATRVAILRELARVSRRFVVATWFHPVSVHHARRLLARDSARVALFRRELRAEAEEAGLVLEASRAQAPFLRDLWIARFAVRGAPAAAR